METLQVSLTERQMAAASAQTPRAVPVLAADLRALLRDEPADCRASQLFTVERAVRFGGGGLKSVAANDLKKALELFDVVGCRTPGLGILRLQMQRQIASNDAREQAARMSADVRWLPVPLARRPPPEAASSTLQMDSGFPDTVSTPVDEGQEP